jgi:hypothetical protein
MEVRMLRRLLYALLTMFGACVSTSSPAFAQELPPVPSAVVSQLGPVPIRFVARLECGGKPVYGCFDGVARTIYLRDSMPIAVQWHTLFHEQFHVVLHDGGQSLRNPDGTLNPVEDKLADAVATARVNELLVLLQQMAMEQADSARRSVSQARAPAKP